jgi:hypothetical protein
MKPWTKEDFDSFKVNVCDENICSDCKECDRSDENILSCFDDLTAE